MEMGAYYPQKNTGFMTRSSIHPYLLNLLDETVNAESEENDDVFGFSSVGTEGGTEALASIAGYLAVAAGTSLLRGSVEPRW